MQHRMLYSLESTFHSLAMLWLGQHSCSALSLSTRIGLSCLYANCGLFATLYLQWCLQSWNDMLCHAMIYDWLAPLSTIVGLNSSLTCPVPEPVFSRSLTSFMLSWSATSPNTTCFPSSQEVTTVVMKNWDPFLIATSQQGPRPEGTQRKIMTRSYVLGPALAMDNKPGRLCCFLKFSSANFSP